MAATDQTYRNQRTLDIVFAVSCILMLLSTLWMFWQDYDRQFKHVQRDFRDVEEAMNEQQMLAQLPDKEQVEAARKKIADAKKKYEDEYDKLRPRERELLAKRERQDNDYRGIKADFDSKGSFYNIAVEHRDHETDPARQKMLQKEIDDLDKELHDLQAQLTAAQDKLDDLDKEIKKDVTEPLRGPQKEMNDAEDDLKKLTASSDRFAKVAAQKRWKFGDLFRTLPILDAFESPTKIKQQWLPELTIDYGGFKDVPRYDRCISCHLGIERGNYNHEALTSLTRSPEIIKQDIAKAQSRKKELEGKGSEDEAKRAQARIDAMKEELKRAEGMQQKLTDARNMLIARKDGGENLGFDPGDLPKDVHWLKMTPGQITQYAAHPRLDLFVDANSPHRMEKFGCTICHQGQGSATDFVLAVHTPAGTTQEEEWHKEYGWTHSHFWDFPMLSSRFIESSCLKCHHEVTDLVRYGSKQEAPKLLRGFELVRENGCFGCHEISSIKAGREIGPDLRLEPQPALPYLTPAEQDKAKSDPLNLPGQYRKVGPSLRRIAEKTNQDWVRKWVASPRGFRPDTKMPHFYGLTNNNNEALPDDQKKFPDTEIAGIAYYLLTESKGNLESDKKDNARTVLEGQIKLRQDDLSERRLDDREWKELLDASRRLGDLGLMSVPARANEINRYLNEQKQLQEHLQELQKLKADFPARKTKLTERKDALTKKKEEKEKEGGELDKNEEEELTRVTTDLEQLEKRSGEIAEELKTEGSSLNKAFAGLIETCQIVPLAKEISDENGKAVELPKAGDAAKGRKLFTERGCLACHSHEGTEKASLGVGAVHGEANFGPNLSRLAAKIAPEIAGKDGKELDAAKRRWVVQWVMNPTVYHPRTRMPITHLTAEQAADVAEWLLGQKTDWDDKGPQEPTTEDLVALARLYLGKAPGFTRVDVENFLPATAGELPGIPDERLTNLPPDSDERKLNGPLNDDKLKWYIGRKAINRLGCFGCHDVPGFETAKPIGTALNDWGKKDAERLAFEDADVFVRDHFNMVKERDDPENKKKPAADWRIKDGKPPYEKAYFEALKHHRREGFLEQKLRQPRSFDFNRQRVWDDRLRMPQFRFARTKKHENETDDEYQARQDFEEAQAREAVMTFILGLVAEPMPLKYLNKPAPDRLAEVKGHQVLEQFNCSGCHQLRAGVYEFKTSDDGLNFLQGAYNVARSNFKTDHFFAGHNAWFGAAQPTADRLTVFATDPHIDDETYENRRMLMVRLSDALRFTGRDGIVRDIPAASQVPLIPEELMVRRDPWGGTFADLMVRYMKPQESDPNKVRAKLPPPLIREGERVQPNWLYGFLLNPPPVRPTNFMMLRMPKFNMSGEEARTLTNYFSSVSRLSNPGAGVSAEYVNIQQRDEQYWRARTAEYVKRLRGQEKLEERAKEMEPVWREVLKRQIAEAEAELDRAKQALKDAKEGEAKKDAEKDVATREADVKKEKEELDKKDYSRPRKQWEQSGAYAADAYRLLTDRNLCLSCHSVGAVTIAAPSGPDLALTAERLRPEWTRQWIANPDRLFGYTPMMPQNFANDKLKYQEKFIGSNLEQVTAVRDVLMDLSRLADLPGNRSRVAPATGGGK